MRARWVAERIAKTRTNVLLLGPRQVGKSTLCRALAPELYVDLADEREFPRGMRSVTTTMSFTRR